MCLSWKAEAQTLTYSFIDPCTKVVTYFSVPAQGTVIFFLGQSRSFVPGVMERLNRLDGELSNNGGSSVKDAIERIEKILGTK